MPLPGALAPFSIPDISGSSSAVTLASLNPAGNPASARVIQFTTPIANVALIRFGDSAITASRGASLAPGGAQFIEVPERAVIDLATFYVYIVTGDKLQVTAFA